MIHSIPVLTENNGRAFTLTYPDGTIADRFEEQCVPADRSAARIPAGADNWIIMEAPSPGTSNNLSIEQCAEFCSRYTGHFTQKRFL
jgi:hypothetical protein